MFSTTATIGLIVILGIVLTIVIGTAVATVQYTRSLERMRKGKHDLAVARRARNGVRGGKYVDGTRRS